MLFFQLPMLVSQLPIDGSELFFLSLDNLKQSPQDQTDDDRQNKNGRRNLAIAEHEEVCERQREQQ